ncbi:cyclophilin-like fold protein (plasmid) [Fibrella sp. ES10-3-2-2]
MKHIQMLLPPIMLTLLGILACKTDDPMTQERPIPPAGNTAATNPSNPNRSNRVRIRVGTSTFTATLSDNPSVTAFKAQLPLTIVMKELNGNEKFIDLPTSLPTNASNPGTIQAGDLMLYGSSTLVLFYETFQTSYSYTRIGRIENPMGLAKALGTGNVTVTFELE